jgi:hypothetical protein
MYVDKKYIIIFSFSVLRVTYLRSIFHESTPPFPRNYQFQLIEFKTKLRVRIIAGVLIDPMSYFMFLNYLNIFTAMYINVSVYK